jgi:hypothetical protein
MHDLREPCVRVLERPMHDVSHRKVGVMMRNLLLSLVLGTAALVPACGPAYVQVGAEVDPGLVMIGPGVWVVENSPYAVYYADGIYWRYAGGYWYRSSYYDGGFVRVDVGIVPRVVVGAYRPHHVRYRPPAHAQRRPIDRGHRTYRPRR